MGASVTVTAFHDISFRLTTNTEIEIEGPGGHYYEIDNGCIYIRYNVFVEGQAPQILEINIAEIEAGSPQAQIESVIPLNIRSTEYEGTQSTYLYYERVPFTINKGIAYWGTYIGKYTGDLKSMALRDGVTASTSITGSYDTTQYSTDSINYVDYTTSGITGVSSGDTIYFRLKYGNEYTTPMTIVF
jgi:hypothetical protein